MIRRKKRFPTDGHPPRKGLMGGERPDEAQGCRVMGKNEVFHDCNTPGTGIGWGYHPINLKGPVPKRDGPWECSGRVNPIASIGEPSERVSPDSLSFFPIFLDIFHNRFTKVVRTTGKTEWAAEDSEGVEFGR